MVSGDSKEESCEERKIVVFVLCDKSSLIGGYLRAVEVACCEGCDARSR